MLEMGEPWRIKHQQYLKRKEHCAVCRWASAVNVQVSASEFVCYSSFKNTNYGLLR